MKNMLVAISRWHTLADGLARRQDNFLLLRFLAASMVIYGHSYALSGMQKQDIFVRHGLPFSGTIAVDMFFAVSGFLVTGSLMRRSNVISFVLARALRLFPAYAACLVLCAFVLGPLLTTLPLREYLHNPDTLAYVWANLGFQNLRWDLPGVFVHNPYTGTINGSIWTLPAEASMYLWLAALGLFGIFKWRWLASIVLIALTVFGCMQWMDVPMLVHNPPYARFAAIFVLGSFFYLHRERIPLGHGCMLVLALLAYFTHNTGLFVYALGLAEAYFCFWFAYCIPWYGFNRFGDYSYGIYLWGFPCQQFVVALLDNPRPSQISLWAFPLALIIAIVSWHCLEQPALHLKDWQFWNKLGISRAKPAAIPAVNSDNTDAV